MISRVPDSKTHKRKSQKYNLDEKAVALIAKLVREELRRKKVPK